MNIKRCYVIMLLAMITAPFTYAEGNEGGRIAFYEDMHDYGEVKQHTRHVHNFLFSNTGSGPLTIQRVRASCGCTAATPTKRVVQPGEQGEIRVVFDSETFSGSVIKFIHVHSDDPENSVARLSVTAVVLPDLVAEPSHIDFGVVLSGNRAEATAVLSSPAGEEFEVQEMVVRPDFLVATIDEDTPEGRYVLRLYLSADAPMGSFTGSVSVAAYIGRSPLRISVTGVVTGAVTVSPQRLFFGVVRRDAAAYRKITIRASGHQPHAPIIEQSPDWLHCEIQEVAPGQEWLLLATIAEGAEPGFKQSEITLKMADSDEDRISIPVFANIVGAD